MVLNLKTKEEKELVYVKVVELFLKCQWTYDFGSADASCLKKSVDDAFDKYGLNGDKYIKCMISTCADGATVNMGKNTGVLTVMRKKEFGSLLFIAVHIDWNWLLKMNSVK